jgi:trimeric autotransporter adhesin
MQSSQFNAMPYPSIMKSKLLHSLHSLPVGLGLLAAGLSIQSAQAANFVWDENGVTAGFGTAGNTGTNWSTSTSLFAADNNPGTTAPSGTQATTTGDQAIFGKDTPNPGIGAGTITVSGTVEIGTIRFGSGTGQGAVTLSGGTINLAAAGSIVGNAAGATISSALTGAATTLSLAANGGNGGVNLSGGYTGGGTLSVGSGSHSLTAGTYTVAAVTTGNSEFRFLNLNGGTLKSAGNIYASGVAAQLTINGGTLQSNNVAGITVFDWNNVIAIGSSGATFDTTVGNINLGTNSLSTANNVTFKGASGNTFTANALALANNNTVRFDLTGVTINNSVSLVSLTTFTETSDGGAYNIDFGGFGFTTPGSYKLIGFGSVSSSFLAADFAALNATVGSGLTANFVLDSSSLSYVVTAVPEPSSFAALAGLVVLGFAATRRRSA